MAHTKAFSLEIFEKNRQKARFGTGFATFRCLLLGVAKQQARLQIQSASVCRSPNNSMVTDLERLLQVAKQKDYKSFLPSYLSNSQIFLDPHVDGCQCGYTTNVWRKTTIWICFKFHTLRQQKPVWILLDSFDFIFSRHDFFYCPVRRKPKVRGGDAGRTRTRRNLALSIPSCRPFFTTIIHTAI